MDEFFEPTYTIDFTDEGTRKGIRGAKCGDSIAVKLRLTNGSGTPALEATGTRGGDGKQFDVRLTTFEGYQDFGWNYEDVIFLVDARGKS